MNTYLYHTIYIYKLYIHHIKKIKKQTNTGFYEDFVKQKVLIPPEPQKQNTPDQ